MSRMKRKRSRRGAPWAISPVERIRRREIAAMRMGTSRDPRVRTRARLTAPFGTGTRHESETAELSRLIDVFHSSGSAARCLYALALVGVGDPSDGISVERIRALNHVIARLRLRMLRIRLAALRLQARCCRTLANMAPADLLATPTWKRCQARDADAWPPPWRPVLDVLTCAVLTAAPPSWAPVPVGEGQCARLTLAA